MGNTNSISEAISAAMVETLREYHNKEVIYYEGSAQKDSPVLNELFENGFLNSCMYFNSGESKKGRIFYITEQGTEYLKTH